jgi:hypothetical protein
MHALTWTLAVLAAGSEQHLLALLSNPISDLARVDTVLDFEYQLGSDDEGTRQTFALRPSIPLRFHGNWTLIADLHVPLISQQGVDKDPANEQRGVGDLIQTSYIVPAIRGGQDFTWGLGTAIRFGTGDSEALGTGKWGAGPSLALVQYDDRLVSGLTLSQIWGDGGSDAWKLQGFTTWIRARHSIGLQLEVEYDRSTETTRLPLSAEVSRLVHTGGIVLNLTAGARFYIDVAENLGPWGLHFSMTCARRN